MILVGVGVVVSNGLLLLERVVATALMDRGRTACWFSSQHGTCDSDPAADTEVAAEAAWASRPFRRPKVESAHGRGDANQDLR